MTAQSLMRSVRNLVLVLGDQPGVSSAALDAFDPEAGFGWMAEVAGEARHIWAAKPHIAVFLSCMHHFRDKVNAQGFPVDYRHLDDPETRGTLGAELRRAEEAREPKGPSWCNRVNGGCSMISATQQIRLGCCCRSVQTVTTYARGPMGDLACPFTALHWDFLKRHEALSSQNRRMGLELRDLRRIDADEQHAVRQRASRVRRDLVSDWGATGDSQRAR